MKLYNIYIPKFYNNGEKIPQEKIAKILDEIIEKFGVSSYQENAKLPLVQGVWISKEGKRYSDVVSLVCLILEDTVDHNKWFIEKSRLWRQELEQEEFFIVVQYAELIIATK